MFCRIQNYNHQEVATRRDLAFDLARAVLRGPELSRCREGLLAHLFSELLSVGASRS
jgi:hypothetical protein